MPYSKRMIISMCCNRYETTFIIVYKFVNENFNGNIERRTFLIFFKTISLPGRLALSLRGFFPSIYSPM